MKCPVCDITLLRLGETHCRGCEDIWYADEAPLLWLAEMEEHSRLIYDEDDYGVD